MKNKTTMKDIAKRTGFSLSTVSRALNRKTAHMISKETHDRIQEVLRMTGYEVNPSGRKARLEKNRTLVFLAFFKKSRSLLGSLSMEFQKGMLQGAAEYGYRFEVSTETERLFASAADGYILAGENDSDVLSEKLRKDQIPHVVIHSLEQATSAPMVTTDQFGASVAMTELLINKGYKRIGFVSLPLKNSWAGVRGSGYRHALSSHDIPEKIYEYPSYEGLEDDRIHSDIAKRLIADGIEAVYCVNDIIAYNLSIQFKYVFKDYRLAIAGYDDLPGIADRYDLTTVHVPRVEMGYYAVKDLIAQIDSGEISPHKRLIPFSIIERGSTAKVSDEK